MSYKINKIDNCSKEIIDGCEICKHYINIEKSINNFTTNELVEELRKREGVRPIDVKPYNSYYISVDEDFEDVEVDETGSAIILIVTY